MVYSRLDSSNPSTGEPLRVTGKVFGELNGVQLTEVDLHSYVLTADGRTYTALSRVPRVSWQRGASGGVHARKMFLCHKCGVNSFSSRHSQSPTSAYCEENGLYVNWCLTLASGGGRQLTRVALRRRWFWQSYSIIHID